MLKKFLSKIGIGAATVDLVLDQQTARVGEEATGTIIINGGNVDQQIDAIFVNLDIEAKRGDHTARRKVDSVRVATNLQIKAGENMQMPFHYVIPELPQSTKYVSYTFHTSLDIPGAIDKHDFDRFIIQPRASVGLVKEALQAMGFQESYDSGEFDGYFQEFEYKVHSGPFRGRIDELELIFLPVAEGVEMHVELDKRGRGLGGFLAEALDRDEQYAVALIPNEALTSRDAVIEALTRFLEAELNNPHPNRYPTLPRHQHKGHHGHHGHRKHGGGSIAGAVVGGFAGYALGEALFGNDEGDAADGGDLFGGDDGGDFGDFGGGEDF
jgi:sporulation-control protein